MSGKCEHGLTTREGFTCASAKYGVAAPAYVPLSDRDIRALPEWWPSYEQQPSLMLLCRAIESLVVARMRGEGK